MHAMASKQQQKYSLPLDIWIFILCRLPAESLVRCSFVCKAWHDLIHSAFFVNTHLNYQKTAPNTNKYILHIKDMCSTLETDCDTIFDETKEDCKLYYTPESFGREYDNQRRRMGIWGVCDGLLCVSDQPYHVGDDIHLWNPICRKAKKLPKLEISLEKDPVWFSKNKGAVSFGCYNDDYKVIVISPVDNTSYIVSVYSLSSNSWKTFPPSYINLKPDFDGFWPVKPTRFIDGTAYMLTHRGRAVVWFDLRDEVSGQIKLPDKTNQCVCPNNGYTLEAYGGKLAVFGRGGLHIGMWILKDKSESISPLEFKFFIKLMRLGTPVGFLPDGKYLVRTCIRKEDVFFSCDLESQKLIKFRSIGSLISHVSTIVSNCVESLLLLNEDSMNPFVDSKMGSSCNNSGLFSLYNYMSTSPVDRNKRNAVVYA